MTAHREHLASHQGVLVLAGAALSDDGEEMTGSCFVISANSREEAEAFVHADPFALAGVFADIDVTRMRKGFWNPAAADGE